MKNVLSDMTPERLAILAALTTLGPDGKRPIVPATRLQELSPKSWRDDISFLAREAGIPIGVGKYATEGAPQGETCFQVYTPKDSTKKDPAQVGAPSRPSPGSAAQRKAPPAPKPQPASLGGGCTIRINSLRLSSSGGRTKMTAVPASPADAQALLEFAAGGSGENKDIVFATLTRAQIPGPGVEKPPAEQQEAAAKTAPALPAAQTEAPPAENTAEEQFGLPGANFEAAGVAGFDPAPGWIPAQLPETPGEDPPAAKTAEQIEQEIAGLGLPPAIAEATGAMMRTGAGLTNPDKARI